jgi:hypothetical protein
VWADGQPALGKHLQHRNCKKKQKYQEKSPRKCGVKIRTSPSLDKLISFDLIRVVII